MTISNEHKGEETVALLIAHYNAAREDILSKVALRDRYIYLCAVGSGLIMWFSWTTTNSSQALILVPFLIWITAVLFAQVDRLIGMIALWLKEDYSAEVTNLIGHSVTHWDGSNIGDRLITSSTFRLRYFGIGSIFMILGYAALLTRIELDPTRFAFLGGLLAEVSPLLAGEPNAPARALALAFANLVATLETLVFVIAPVASYYLATHTGSIRKRQHVRPPKK